MKIIAKVGMEGFCGEIEGVKKLFMNGKQRAMAGW